MIMSRENTFCAACICLQSSKCWVPNAVQRMACHPLDKYRQKLIGYPINDKLLLLLHTHKLKMNFIENIPRITYITWSV